MAGIIVFFVLNDKKISSNMAHISEHINHSNHRIHSYIQMEKNIVNLVSENEKQQQLCRK